MSISISVYAMDSAVEAPEVGVDGHIGGPPVDSTTGNHKFLLIYNALTKIGLNTRELEVFKAFLDQYGDERLYYWEEGDPGTSAEAIELDEMLEDDRVVEFEMTPELPNHEFIYELRCGDEVFTATESNYFAEVNEFEVDKSELTDLITQVFDVPSWDTEFYCQWGLLDPYDGDLGDIRAFIMEHDGPFQVAYLKP
ncbi:MAG: hypothetical protein AAF525_16765 [Pseudomonadota bacterium]